MDLESEIASEPPPPPAARGKLAPAVDARHAALLRGRMHGAAFLMDAVGYSYPVMASAYAQETLGASALELGVLGFVSPFTYALGCLLVGRLSDRFGSMHLVRLGIVLYAGIVLPAFLVASSIPTLYLVSVAFGLSTSFFWTPLIRQLALLSPGAILWRSLGVFNISWALGATAGSIGGPHAYRELGRPGAALVCALLAIVALAATSFRARSIALPDGPAEPLERVDPRVARRFLFAGWTANFVGALASGALQYLAVYLARQLLLDERGRVEESDVLALAGFILLAKEGGRLLGFVSLRYWSGWHYSLPWLCAFQIAGGGALVVAGCIGSAAACVALVVVFGIFTGLSYYSSLYYSMNLRSDEGRKSGLHEGILAFGVATGPPSCGAAAYFFRTPGVVPLLAGVFVVAGLAVELFFIRGRGTRPGGLPSENPC